MLASARERQADDGCLHNRRDWLLGPSHGGGQQQRVALQCTWLGSSFHPSGLICRWERLSSRDIQGNGQGEASLCPSDPSKPSVVRSGHGGCMGQYLLGHLCVTRHCALALSSSLCTVLYSTWKCWWGERCMRDRESGRAGGSECCPTQGNCTAAHLDGRVRHGEVRPNAQGQQQVEDGWLDPEGQSMGSRMGELDPHRLRCPVRGVCRAHHSPVSVHHLLQLVVKDKLRVPVERQPRFSAYPQGSSSSEGSPGVAGLGG